MIVVKAGGRALEANLDKILESLAKHFKLGRKLIFVHGGGDIVSRYERLMGLEPRFITSPSGIRSRYTDEKELEVYVMVMAGKLNKEIVARLQALGVKAIGLSGADGALLKAVRKKKLIIVDERGRKRVIKGGYTGSIKEVDVELLERILDSGYLAVISPIAIGSEHELLNVDADQAASAIAIAAKAEKLLILTDVEGLILDGRLIHELHADDFEKIKERIGVGMNRKVMLCVKAVKNGVRAAIISSGLIEDPLSAIEGGRGTRILP